MQSAVIATTVHGAKHVCSDCAAKFYDLGKKGANCPKCGGRAVVDSLPSRGRPTAASRRATVRR